MAVAKKELVGMDALMNAVCFYCLQMDPVFPAFVQKASVKVEARKLYCHMKSCSITPDTVIHPEFLIKSLKQYLPPLPVKLSHLLNMPVEPA